MRVFAIVLIVALVGVGTGLLTMGIAKPEAGFAGDWAREGKAIYMSIGAGLLAAGIAAFLLFAITGGFKGDWPAVLAVCALSALVFGILYLLVAFVLLQHS